MFPNVTISWQKPCNNSVILGMLAQWRRQETYLEYMSKFFLLLLKLLISYVSKARSKFYLNYFCGMVDRRKAFTPYFQPRPLSEILTIANLRHAESKVWTHAESEFRLCWMKLCSSDNHYTTAPKYTLFIFIIFIYTLFWWALGNLLLASNMLRIFQIWALKYA